MSGPAVGGGVEYQASLAAYLAAAMLSGDIPSGLGHLVVGSPVTLVWSEGPAAVDDIEVRTAAGERILIQAKRSAGLETSSKSPLAKGMEQIVNAFHAGEPHTRLALVVGSAAPDTVKNTLADVVERIRVKGDLDKSYVAPTAADKDAMKVLLDHITGAWPTSTAPSELEIVELLSKFYIAEVAVEPGDRHEIEARTWLSRILRAPSDAHVAWAVLEREFLTAMKKRTGCGAAAATDILRRHRVELVSPGGISAVASLRSPTTGGPLKCDLFELDIRNDGSVPLRVEQVLPTDRQDRNEIQPGHITNGALGVGVTAQVSQRFVEDFTGNPVPLVTSPMIEIVLRTDWPSQSPERWHLLVSLTAENRTSTSADWRLRNQWLEPA